MIVEKLLELEPGIRRIADRGAEFQGKVPALTKSETGSLAADVVTEADLWVQKQLLHLLLDSGLSHFSLIAEESDPELLSGFHSQSPVKIYLDPIDGTKRFVEGTPYFSTIVSVRNGQDQIYSYTYYPRLNWWLRLMGEDCFEMSAAVPLELPVRERTVVYTSGSAEKDFGEWHAQLPEWDWKKGDALHPCGSKLLYLSGRVAGYACANPNVYDGLMIYHYARVRRHECRLLGPQVGDELDMENWDDTPRGLALQGRRYLCLQASRPA